MTRLRTIAPLLAAGVLAAAAVATVQRAGCETPGHYELTAEGYALVGGCIAPGDIVLPAPQPAPAPAPVEVKPDKG